MYLYLYKRKKNIHKLYELGKRTYKICSNGQCFNASFWLSSKVSLIRRQNCSPPSPGAIFFCPSTKIIIHTSNKKNKWKEREREREKGSLLFQELIQVWLSENFPCCIISYFLLLLSIFLKLKQAKQVSSFFHHNHHHHLVYYVLLLMLMLHTYIRTHSYYKRKEIQQTFHPLENLELFLVHIFFSKLIYKYNIFFWDVILLNKYTHTYIFMHLHIMRICTLKRAIITFAQEVMVLFFCFWRFYFFFFYKFTVSCV